MTAADFLPHRLPHLLRVIWVVIRHAGSLGGRIEACRSAAKADEARFSARWLADASDETLLEQVRMSEELAAPSVVHVWASTLASVAFTQLRRFTARWLGDQDGALASELVTGIQSLPSTEPALVLHALSQKIGQSDELALIFRSEADDAACLRGASKRPLARRARAFCPPARPSRRRGGRAQPSLLARGPDSSHLAHPKQLASRSRDTDRRSQAAEARAPRSHEPTGIAELVAARLVEALDPSSAHGLCAPRNHEGPRDPPPRPVTARLSGAQSPARRPWADLLSRRHVLSLLGRVEGAHQRCAKPRRHRPGREATAARLPMVAASRGSKAPGRDASHTRLDRHSRRVGARRHGREPWQSHRRGARGDRPKKRRLHRAGRDPGSTGDRRGLDAPVRASGGARRGSRRALVARVNRRAGVRGARVVGVAGATRTIETGDRITLDGATGQVFKLGAAESLS